MNLATVWHSKSYCPCYSLLQNHCSNVSLFCQPSDFGSGVMLKFLIEKNTAQFVGATGRLIGCISGEEGLVEFSCLVSLLAWDLISVSVGDTLAVVACALQVITASPYAYFLFFSCLFSFFFGLHSPIFFPLIPKIFAFLCWLDNWVAFWHTLWI